MVDFSFKFQVASNENLLLYIVVCPSLSSGQDEGWWLGSLGDTFGCPLTAATPSLLRSELEACQELLQLEPKNKCELCLHRVSIASPSFLSFLPSFLSPNLKTRLIKNQSLADRLEWKYVLPFALLIDSALC